MDVPAPKYGRKEIGSATVRIPSGTGMPDPLDVAVDPYAPTKVAKQVFIKGFQAWPQKAGPFPAVLILHEWWGLNSHFQDYVKKNRIAVLGFSMGGSHGLSFACARRQLRAAVIFYGHVPTEKLSTLRCPVLYHQAENDESVTEQEVHHLVSALTANKVMCEVHKYPGTAHSFFNDTRPEVYKEEAAAEAWSRTLAFLDKYILADHPGVRPLPDSQRVR